MPGADPSLLEGHIVARAAAQLVALVEPRTTADGAAWLRETAASVARGDVDVRVAFPSVSRRIGRGGLGAPGDATLAVELGGRRHAMPVAAWRVDDAARAVLVCAAACRHPGDPAGIGALVRDLYERGDARERTGALRALSLVGGLAGAEAALPAIFDAVRTSQGEIFEAAVCDNPYASTFLPELEFRKAVLKAVFIGLSIQRIARLEERADGELAASLLDLVTEREAATRTVAPELWPVIALFPPPGLAAKLLGYLEHPAVEHRVAAAVALGRLARAGDDRIRAFLIDRLGRESAVAVRVALERTLA